MTLVLAATGLKREASLIAGLGVKPLVSGGVADRLEARLEGALSRDRVAGIISVGLGGALSPALAVGDWVVGESIVDRAMIWPTDAVWTARIAAALGSSGRLGALAGSDTMVSDADAKSALHHATGAVAVDMESHVAARVAAAHNLPLAAVRVMSDDAGRTLPKAALAGMRPDGGMNLWGVLWALAQSPQQLPALIRTGREAETAFRALALLGGDNLLCGPGIGCPYLRQLLLDMP